jgi:hypothetical protein
MGGRWRLVIHPEATALLPLQVIEPRVQAFLYTWGAGRVTAEGEQIPGGGRAGRAGHALPGSSALALAVVEASCLQVQRKMRAVWCEALGRLTQLPVFVNDCQTAFATHGQHVLYCLYCLYCPAVRCEALDIGYIDGMLLLPLIVEHNIGGAGCWWCCRSRALQGMPVHVNAASTIACASLIVEHTIGGACAATISAAIALKLKT